VTPEHSNKAREIADAALDVAPDAREAFVAVAGGGDDDLLV
jgi:hypothetical protein